MKKFRVSVNDKEFIVSVEEIDGSATEAAVPPTDGPQLAPKAATPPAPKAPAATVSVGTNEEPVEAPLRGNIVQIIATEGQKVKEGEVLLTLEAMKLENEITSPSEATVARILVQQGDSVEPGDILVVLRSDG